MPGLGAMPALGAGLLGAGLLGAGLLGAGLLGAGLLGAAAGAIGVRSGSRCPGR